MYISPYAVAEHAIALLMALNRKVHRASTRTKDANFSLDGLVGFDLHGKTVAVVGCGRVRPPIKISVHLYRWGGKGGWTGAF